MWGFDMAIKVYKIDTRSELAMDMILYFMFHSEIYEKMEPVLLTPKGIHQFLSMIERGETNIFMSFDDDFKPMGFIHGRFDAATRTYFSHCCFLPSKYVLEASRQTEALMRQIYNPLKMICNIPENNRAAILHALKMGLKKVGENKNLVWDGKIKSIQYIKEY